MKEKSKRTALQPLEEQMHERSFVVEVAPATPPLRAIRLGMDAATPQSDVFTNNVDIRALCRPLTASALLEGISRFYGENPLVFSPIGLKLDANSPRDNAALRIFLRLTC